jgi:hypothetical protein
MQAQLENPGLLFIFQNPGLPFIFQTYKSLLVLWFLRLFIGVHTQKMILCAKGKTVVRKISAWKCGKRLG